MDQATQQNAAMVEESTAASHAMAREADALHALIRRFQLAGDAAQPVRQTSSPAPASQLHAMARTMRAPRAATAQAAESWEEF
jgi:methyl-accepting chemotaxis protein